MSPRRRGGVDGGRGGGDGLALRVDGVRHKGLSGVSFTVGAGEMVAVVCAPAEAAALVEVLDRSADPEGGSVTVGGVAHRELTLDEARRVVTVAHHDGPLFGGTLLDNVVAAAAPVAGSVVDSGVAPVAGTGVDVAVPPVAGTGGDAAAGLPGPSPGAAPGSPGRIAWLDPLLAAAGLHDVLEAIGGLHGPLTDEGRSLSGGQRQRVALARALATGAPVLVLDEPTTAVDTATEHRIAAGLRSVRAGRTTVVITSSPPLLAVADRVVVVAGGRVGGEGAHADLVAADEGYRRAVLR